MKCEIHINGRLILELQPETAIERMVLVEMATGAMQGKVAAMVQLGSEDKFQVAVDK